MSGQDDSADKSHEPSPRKLEEARKKGEIARAPDMSTAMAYLGLLVCCLVFGAQSLKGFGDAMIPLIEQPDRLEATFFRDGATAVTGSVMMAAITPLLSILLVPGLFVLATLLSTRSLLFTGSKLAFKASRISPIENAKNKYGRRGLFEFFKSFLKLSVYSVSLAFFLVYHIDEIVGAVRGTPQAVMGLLAGKIVLFLGIVVLIAMVIGGLDFVFQRAEHLRKNRMSHKELRDEFKESEGDPMLKQQRRARAQDIALNQMLSDVPKADVVIVNPTHYAVALQWSRMSGSAPVCVAKGCDAIAARIREVAEAEGVPIRSDPPTARALYASTEIGAEISPEQYAPVAAAIRFAETMRQKARAKGWG